MRLRTRPPLITYLLTASEQVVLMVSRGPSAGRVEGGAVGCRGCVVGGPFARGRGDV